MGNKFEDLEKLKQLKEDGTITEEEFNAEKTKILNSDNDNNSSSNESNNKNILEIKGDFPFAESKIPLELLEGEKVILQYVAVIAEMPAVNGLITLTNKRLLFNKHTGKAAAAGTGLLGVALATRKKNETIEFSKIVSIEPAKYIQGSAGIKLVTNDGYTHKYALQSLNTFSKEPQKNRDTIIQLVQTVISSK